MADICRRDHFQPIEDYGVIGNMQTMALISRLDASIDHLCFPHFDSPLIFGRLLSRQGGGYFQISPSSCSDWKSKQLYLHSSNVLMTRFFGAAGGIGQVTDFMPVQKSSKRKQDIDLGNGVCSENNIEDYFEGMEVKDRGLPWIVRKVEAIRGNIRFLLECQPAFNYGRQSHQIKIHSEDNTVSFESEDSHLSLSAYYLCPSEGEEEKTLNWQVLEEKVEYPTGQTVSLPKLLATFELGETRSLFFLLRNPQDGEFQSIDGEVLERSLKETDRFWHRWIDACTYKGRWREIVYRSALALKLMTFKETGAIIASPTTSLPEQLGGDKNWDYRFTWIRDAAFTVYAFLRIGLREEAGEFMKWIENRCEDLTSDAEGLRLMYDIRGGHPLIKVKIKKDKTMSKVVEPRAASGDKEAEDVGDDNMDSREDGTGPMMDLGMLDNVKNVDLLIKEEELLSRGERTAGVKRKASSKDEWSEGGSILATEITLDHWSGYRDSGPVRIGNLAAFQNQLDIYGELIDAIYLCDKWVSPISYEFWCTLRDRIIPQVERRWREADHGIWEARGPAKHHVYSKVMAWVALDRAVRLANKHSLPAPLEEWMRIRNEIYESVMKEGYNEELGAFTQCYGGTTLDASNLIMPLVFFLPPDDPRFLGTLLRTMRPPRRGGLTVNHLVFRYEQQQQGEECVMEGTFSMCSFWLVEALARAGVRHPTLLDESQRIFEDIIGYANHLGLFSEQIGLEGCALGNFPQALTHQSLISAAFNLDRALDNRQVKETNT